MSYKDAPKQRDKKMTVRLAVMQVVLLYVSLREANINIKMRIFIENIHRND